MAMISLLTPSPSPLEGVKRDGFAQAPTCAASGDTRTWHLPKLHRLASARDCPLVARFGLSASETMHTTVTKNLQLGGAVAPR